MFAHLIINGKQLESAAGAFLEQTGVQQEIHNMSTETAMDATLTAVRGIKK